MYPLNISFLLINKFKKSLGNVFHLKKKKSRDAIPLSYALFGFNIISRLYFDYEAAHHEEM